MITTEELDTLMQNIEGHLQSPEFVDEQMLLGDATSFSDLSHEINRILLKASRLIDQGLRDDALKLMGADAEVLTHFEKIDFPEREDWCELLEIYGIAIPPKLNVDAAARVNETFSTLGDLQGLLKNHRIYALARAPLSARLNVLHALSIKDPSNPIWQSDFESFRKARSQQLAREVEIAIQTENYVKVQTLANEMESPILKGFVDPKHLVLAHTSLAAQTQRDGMDRLKVACSELQTAYVEMDTERGLESIGNVLQLLDEVQLDSSSELYADIQPALAWAQSERDELTQQQRDRELIGDLESAIENSRKLEPIELAYQRAVSMGSRLPQTLQLRAIERIESFQLVAKRRTLLILGSTVAALIFIAASLGFWIYTSQREAAALAIEKTLEDLVEQEKLDEADAFAEKQQMEIQSRPKVQATLAEIKSSKTKEDQRKKEFAAVLGQLKNDAGDQPNTALIGKLKQLAKTTDEKLELREQESIADEKRLAIAKVKQEEALDVYRGIEKSVEGILQRKLDGLTKSAQLRNEKNAILEFLNGNRTGQDKVTGLARQLDRLIDASLQKIEEESQVSQRSDSITAAVGDVNAYKNAIQELIDRHPTSPLALQLEIQSIASALNQNTQWLELADSSASKNPYQTTSASAKEWLDRFGRANAIRKGHYLSEPLQACEPILRRQLLARATIESLTDLAQSQLLDKMYVYPYRGAKYYSWDKPTDTKKSIAYLADFSFAELELKFDGTYAETVRPIVRVAGHSEFGLQMRSIVKSMKEEDFTIGCFKILTELNKVPTDRIDPMFKLFLYRRLFQKMIPASDAIEAGFGDFFRGISGAEPFWETNWLAIEKKDAELNDARSKAELILKSLEDWETRKQRMSDTYKKNANPKFDTLQWVGWIGADGDQKVVRCKSEVPDQELVAIADYQSKSTLVNLGINQGKIFPVSEIGKTLPFGTPIYAVRQTP